MAFILAISMIIIVTFVFIWAFTEIIDSFHNIKALHNLNKKTKKLEADQSFITPF